MRIWLIGRKRNLEREKASAEKWRAPMEKEEEKKNVLYPALLFSHATMLCRCLLFCQKKSLSVREYRGVPHPAQTSLIVPNPWCVLACVLYPVSQCVHMTTARASWSFLQSRGNSCGFPRTKASDI